MATQLWRLWDMLQLPIGRLFETYHHLAASGQILATAIQGHINVQWPDADYQWLLKDAEEFAELCKEASLAVTHQAATRVSIELRRISNGPGGLWILDVHALHRTKNAIEQVVACMRNESITKVALILAAEQSLLFNPNSPLFGNDVSTKFPRVSWEIDEAAKCLALDRATACVFHLMRTLEAALNAIRSCLNIPAPANPNWGAILTPIQDKVSAMGKSHSEHGFFEEIHARLDVIRRAWRNGTMHVEIVYTEEDARILFDATKGLMRKIASGWTRMGSLRFREV